jgi:hypothetical protein
MRLIESQICQNGTLSGRPFVFKLFFCKELSFFPLLAHSLHLWAERKGFCQKKEKQKWQKLLE